MARPLTTIIDNFYSEPDAVRKHGLAMSLSWDEELMAWRTQRYCPRGIRKRIETVTNCSIRNWEDETVRVSYRNGAFFTGFSEGKYAQVPSVHYDIPKGWMTLLIYLTPNAPSDAGISMWQHRETGLTAGPTQQDAKRLKLSLSELSDILAKDSENPRRWKEIDRIGNIYNRAVMFTSGRLHSASRHFGKNQLTGRVFQAFRFSILWKP